MTALIPGTRFGPYEILVPIGAGGMGEVYRARDTKLDRDVAVKILPSHFAQDQDRLARFEREAKAVAALSHPNILAIHDFGRHDGTTYAVMELLEGNTLRDRLAGGALPQRKAVEYAAQIASGLSAAHDKGIVHRDLKPDNLFVTSDGRVKILDFGLAALVEASPEDLSQSPTRERATDPGTVLGTVGYMSPEQARGQKADARSDVFSLGCVLYEMLSGKRAFRRETTAETLTAILREDPPSLSEMTPPLSASLERMLLHCLEKRPEDRFQSARDLAFDLQAMSDPSGSELRSHAGGRAPTPARLRWLWPAATVMLGVTVVALMTRGPSSNVGERRATFANIAVPPDVQLDSMRLSNDGRRLAILGERLWILDLDSGIARSLAGTENTLALAALSRDARRIRYVASDALKEVEVETGAIRTLGAIPRGSGTGISVGSENSAGDLIWSRWCLFHFAASGGDAKVLVVPDASRGERFLHAPQFLPDGQHYLFSVVGTTPEQSGVYAGALGSSERRLILPSIAWAAFAPQGYLLFHRESTLFAQPFDAGTTRLSGEPERVVDGLFLTGTHVPIVWAAGDSLVFVSGPTALYQLTWFDRAGREAGRVGEPAEILTFDVSPDGSRVATSGGSRGALWLMDVSSRATKQLLPFLAYDPRFSADAQSILFSGGPLDQRGLYRMSLSGGNQDVVRRATKPAPGALSGARIILHDWSRDGRMALYFEDLEDNLWSAPLSGNDEPRLVVKSKGNIDEARFSPDARWVAYNEYEVGGRPEVVVVPFPSTGQRWPVSTAGGVQPLWRGDGRELFYLDPAGNLMSVEVTTTPTFSHGTPRLLFRTGIASPSPYVDDYGVTAFGQRFLLKLPAATNRPPELKLVLDWPALLGKAKQP